MLQYNVTAEEYKHAYAEYLEAVQKEEARQEYLAEVRYRELYGDQLDDDLLDDAEENVEHQDLDNEEEEESPATAEYKFFSTKMTRSNSGE